MLPLRYTVGWRVAGVLVLLAVFAATVTPALGLWPTVDIDTYFAIDKWLHALTFLFLSLWFAGQYAKRAYWRIGLGLIVFGGMIEMIQRSLTYRTGDFADLAANFVGIFVGLSVALAGLGGWSLRVESWLGAGPVGDHSRRD